MASAARHEFRPQPEPLPQEYATARSEMQPRNEATFSGLLQQLDELLISYDEPPRYAVSPPAVQSRIQELTAGPTLHAPEHEPPSPPPEVWARPAAESPGRHALGHVVVEDREDGRGEVYRPVIPKHSVELVHTPRHAKDMDALPERRASGMHRAVEHSSRSTERPGRWKVAIAAASAVAVAGVGVSVAATLETRPPATQEVLDPYAEMRLPGAASRHERPSTLAAGPEKATPKVVELQGMTEKQAKAFQPFAEALRTIPQAELKGVSSSALLAKAVTVSSWGSSNAMKTHNNPFEVKDHKGKLVRYGSLKEALVDQARRIKASPYYRDARLFPGQAADSAAADGRTFLLAGADATEIRTNLIFAFFRREGLTDAQIAGMIGNFVRESGINPAAVQKWGGSAKGLAQWEGGRWVRKRGSGSPWLSLTEFAAKEGTQWTSLGTQLRFMMYEFTHSEKKAYRMLRDATGHIGATHVFAYGYERPNRAKRMIRMDIREKGATKALKHRQQHTKHTQAALVLMQAPAFTSHFV